MQGRKIRDSLFGLVARIRIDDLKTVSSGEGVEEIQQSNFVVLIEAAAPRS